MNFMYYQNYDSMPQEKSEGIPLLLSLTMMEISWSLNEVLLWDGCDDIIMTTWIAVPGE